MLMYYLVIRAAPAPAPQSTPPRPSGESRRAPRTRPVVSPRPVVWRRFHAIDATRFLESWRWVVSFSVLSHFVARRGRLAELLVKLRERRRSAGTAARAAAMDARGRLHAVAALRDA